jgi:hypothetical protein
MLGRLLSWRGRLPWVVYTSRAEGSRKFWEPETPDSTFALSQRISRNLAPASHFQHAAQSQVEKVARRYRVNKGFAFWIDRHALLPVVCYLRQRLALMRLPDWIRLVIRIGSPLGEKSVDPRQPQQLSRLSATRASGRAQKSVRTNTGRTDGTSPKKVRGYREPPYAPRSAC